MFPLAGTAVAVSQSRRAPSPGWGEECARRPRTQVWPGGSPFAPGSGPQAAGLEAPGCKAAKKAGMCQPHQLCGGVGGPKVGSG